MLKDVGAYDAATISALVRQRQSIAPKERDAPESSSERVSTVACRLG